MKDTDLLAVVKEDIVRFLNENDEFFFNERDFQMHLALALQKSDHYDDVDVEYAVPKDGSVKISTDDYKWKTEIRLDIVVRKGEEYLPIELKYKTKKAEVMVHRFGMDLGSSVVKDQSAKDLGCYAFWKDVCRLELMCRKFKNVKNGISVFLTNDDSYTRPPRSVDVNYYNFSLAAGKHPTKMEWKNSTGSTADDEYADFDLQKEYVNEWHEVSCQGIKCFYTMVEV